MNKLRIQISRAGTKIFISLLSIMIVIGGDFVPAGADELMGSEKLLAVVKEEMAKGAGAGSADPSTAQLEQFSGDLKSFSERRDTMDPNQAAAGWLALLDRYFSFQDDPNIQQTLSERYGDYTRTPLTIQSIIKAIPGPDSWAHLEGLLQNRPVSKSRIGRETGLRILVYFLNRKADLVKKELDSLESIVPGVSLYDQEYFKKQLAAFKLPILKIMLDTSSADVAENFEKAVDIIAKTRQETGSIRIPDLVALKGAEKAAGIISRLLAMPGVNLTAEEGEETMALARRLALENIDRLSAPQWGLVYSVDSVALYEALEKKFSIDNVVETGSGGEKISDYIQTTSSFTYGLQDLKQRADCYYVLGLLAAGNTEQANTFVTGKGESFRFDSLTKFWQHTGRDDLALPLFDLLHAVLEKNPALPAWEQYVSLAYQVKQTEKSSALMAASIAKLKDDVPRRLNVQRNLFAMDLALDKIEEAVALSREILGTDVSQSPLKVRTEFERNRFDTGHLLTKIGVHLNRPEWVQEGMDVMRSALSNFSGLSPETSYESDTLVQTLCEVLIEHKLFSEAENMLMRSLISKTQRNSMLESMNNFYSVQEPALELALLAHLYNETGRPEDVINLVTNAPWWGFSDVIDLGREDLVVNLAKALRSAGRAEEADKLLKAVILTNPKSDGAYRLLTDHGDPDLIPWLEQVYRMDEFEERPLIWKAVLLLKEGRLAEAEKTARQAIQIDPTDGEQQKGERVFSYTVLADILAAQDKKDDAQFFNTVVRSVRLAERGDELRDIGLVSRGIKMYDEANAVFADAYCIQWRLAESMYVMGNKEAAIEHYQIAFERMPEQFGRVASFCFGCQGVFQKQQSREIADDVLTRLKDKESPKPQVYFLLGQLRESQNRYGEAYALYKQAVTVDPDYFDAWSQMNSISDKVYVSQAEKDSFVLKLLKMDPLQRHFSGGLEQMLDLKSMWQTLMNKKDLFVPKPDSIFELTASRQRVAMLREKMGAAGDYYQSYYYGYSYWPVFNHPGNIVAEHVVSSTVQSLMQIDLTYY